MLNKLTYQGRLVADAELKKTNNGTSATDITIAWSEKYNERETKCFLRCKAWGSTAELLCKHFRKGKEIIIEGKLSTEEWEKEGKKQSKTICTIDRVHFCGSKQDGENTSRPPVNSNALNNLYNFSKVADDAGDLPF